MIKEKALKMYADGYTLKTIGAHLGVTRSTIAGIIHRAFKAGDVDHRGSPLFIDRVAQWMAEKGGSTEECAADILEPLDKVKTAWRAICKKQGQAA
jgi:DNA-binding CsgD family transcriptional regulator